MEERLTMTSPCMNCQRRKLGCHNVDTCQEWKAHEEAKKKEYAERIDYADGGYDYEQHQKRHGRKLPRR